MAVTNAQDSQIFVTNRRRSSSPDGRGSIPPWGLTNFAGGNISGPSINSIAAGMAAASQTSSPTSGGTLTVNSVSLGSYDYLIKKGNQTISSFTATDWFTTTQDTRSAWVIVDGDLTIDNGITFTPSVRKLFTVIYVNGNLTVNGSISMTARGANHSGSGNSGGATTKANIRIAEGTYSTVVDPYIPANGGASIGPVQSGGGYYSLPGNPGTNGGTGGGGAGTVHNNNTQNSVGAAGTSFGGGGGGGAVRYQGNTSRLSDSTAQPNGGRGGHGWGDNFQASGGAGNPGGVGYTTGGNAGGTGQDGTGGVLIIVCRGTFSGSGSVSANGSNGGSTTNIGGSGSGGGSVTIFYGADDGPTPTANGGNNAGLGTARKLAIS